jgi:ABC-type oligopeptide transport system ATPase subunit
VSTTAQIVTIISVLLSLFLVTRGFSSHGLSMSQTVKMALIWAVIILVGTLLISRLAG